MKNFYWPVYEHLEKELIELSFSVHFDDIQFEYISDRDDPDKCIKTPPYSVKIGELLIRCCTEMEALIMELTQDERSETEIKEKLFFDKNQGITIKNRITYLNSEKGLSKKEVQVICSNMFFVNRENKFFAPFEYEKGSVNDYISAYNAIKHNRNVNTIYKANIRILLRAFAALYILNLHFRYKDFPVWESDSTFGSDIFKYWYIENGNKVENDISFIRTSYEKYKENLK